MHPIVDLHCDLLCYLANDPKRKVYDHESRCSLPQMQKGNVKLQTLAVFTETSQRSLKDGDAQIEQFIKLQKEYPKDFHSIKKNQTIFFDQSINMLLSIENASALCSEDESLENFFKRIEYIENEISKILYISLTWNLENRFGGGAHTEVGLKDDGKKLLNFLHNRQIAVDLSHTSDLLAVSILDYIDAKNLKIPVVASHSNFRSVTNIARNLPDEIAKEIILRGGLIGFTLYKAFVGPDLDYFSKQLQHLIDLGGEKNVAFGADFFCGYDLPLAYRKPMNSLFFDEFGDASCYLSLISHFENRLSLDSSFIENIAYKNFINFYKKNILISSERIGP